MMKRRLEPFSLAGMSSECRGGMRVFRDARRLFSAGGRLRRGFVPGAAQPIGNETDLLFAQYLVGSEGGNAMVVLAIKFLVGGFADNPDHPSARAVTGQIGSGSV